MSVLPAILDWSLSRPLWQRDALRRIIEGADHTDGALIAEITELCLKERQYTKAGESLVAVPLDQSHLDRLVVTHDTVVLKSVGDIKCLNALAAGKLLSFATSGLTVIYGDNGSGKSGYGRILKAVCRSRSPRGPIHPNVFEDPPREPQSATITFAVNGEERTLNWKPSDPPEPLRHVSFFDSGCIGRYVETDNDVAYRPAGLDVLPKLVKICDQVKLEIDTRIESLGKRLELAGLNEGTKAKTFVDGLSAKSTFAEVELACVFTEEDQRRIVALKEILVTLDTESVAQKAKDLRLRAKRLNTLADSLDALRDALSDKKVELLRSAQADAIAKAEASAAASRIALPDEPLPGIGQPAWRALWAAARKFSEEVAYPDQSFPVAVSGAVCVLCQQPLQERGASRLRRFDEFVEQEAQRAAVTASKLYEVQRTVIVDLNVAATIISDGLDNLALVNDVAHVIATQFVVSAAARRTAVLEGCETGVWDALPDLPPSDSDVIRAFAAGIEAQARKVEESAQPEAESMYRTELSELEDRKLLAANKAKVRDYLSMLMRKATLASCQTDTATHTITAKNRDMTRAVFKDGMRQNFEAELRELNLGHLKLGVADQGGQKGELIYQVELRDKKIADAKAADVLSEGEHRCIALAAFFNELAMQEGRSTIVLEDPMSSLDHARRETVARRIVKEAGRRPVVVLTHDLVFLLNLTESAEQMGVGFKGCLLECRGTERGIPIDGLPWKGQKLTSRIGALKNEAAGLVKSYKLDLPEIYDRNAAHLWGKLREAWESGVEEVLLNGAVLRFRRGISTQPLDKLDDITRQDLDTLKRGMTECSNWLCGHTQAAALNSPMPAPDVLVQAIEELDKWRKTIATRRQ